MLALLTFEHLETQQLLVFDTFFHIFVYVYLFWRVIILDHSKQHLN